MNADEFLKTLPTPKDYFSKTSMTPEQFIKSQNTDLVPVGRDRKGMQFIDLERLKTHLHIIGATGSGKSFFLELLIRMLLFMRKSFCLIDPLGFLYDSVVNYIAHHPEYADRVVFFNPTEPSDYMVGYNPLRRARYYPSLAEQVRSLTVSMIKVFETDPAIAKRLSNTLSNSLQPIIEAGLTSFELIHFALSNKDTRDAILSHTDDFIVCDYWRGFDKLPPRNQGERIESFYNRISDFARNEMIKATLGQIRNVIDIEDIVENQKILLVNLSQKGWISEKESYIIGTLLVNELYYYALRRKRKDAVKKPFYLLIDEFQHFLTPNASSILETCRQKGMHMVLSHQHLGQLVSEHLDPPTAIYDAVMSQARNKIIFSVYFQDAEKLAWLFAPEWNLAEVKHQLFRTTVLGYKMHKMMLSGTASGSHNAHSEGSGSASASGSGMTTSSGEVILPEGDGQGVASVHESSASFDSMMSSWSEFSAHMEGTSKVKSSHEALMLMPIIGKELASREFWGKEEQHFRQMVKLIAMPRQHAIVKLVDEPSMMVKIRTISPYPEDAEKIEHALSLSRSHTPSIYLPFRERLELCEANTARLFGAAPEDAQVVEIVDAHGVVAKTTAERTDDELMDF